jgi:hypothetical protein
LELSSPLSYLLSRQICNNFSYRGGPACLTICRLIRWLSTFVAAWLSLKLLQSKKSDAFVGIAHEDASNGVKQRPIHFAGRTMDLTLFAVTRAVDVIIGELWAQRKARRISAGEWNKVSDSLISLVRIID